MREKIRSHTRRHSLLYTISFSLLLFAIPAIIFNYRSLVATRKSFYMSTLERQSLSELSLYNEGSVTLAKQFFNQALGAINSLAKSDDIREQVTASKASSESLADLTQKRAMSRQFDALVVLSAEGRMVALSSNAANAASLKVGTDESRSLAYMTAKHASGAVLINAHQSPLNRTVFSIAAPIRDTNGRLLGVVIGSITLKTLAQRIQLASQYDTGLSALLTDADGNVLVWQDKPAVGVQNKITSEPTLKALTVQQDVPANEEYNFAGTDSFAQGTTLDFKTAGKLYLVSFYDTTGYRQRVADAIQGINSTFSGFILRDGLLFVGVIIIVGVTIKVHEKRNT